MSPITSSLNSRRKKQPDFLQIVRAEIRDAMEWKHYKGREFVPRDRLRAIWTVDRLADMAGRYKAFHNSDISRDLSEHIQVLSLLVDIQWENWSVFGGIFLEHPGRTDGDIQGNVEKVLQEEELRGKYMQAILERRGLFYPVDVVEGGDTVSSDQNQRALPFLESESIAIASLPCGFVTRESVPRDHLRLRPKSNMPSKYFVCMRLTSRGNVDERTVLGTLKTRLLRHEHLMPIFATITFETKYTLLFQKTELDLEQLLSGQMGALPLPDLMAKCCGIADALALMHERANGKPPHCHMDLNPASIQITQSGINGAGKWKITGFRFSVISRSKPWTMGDGEYAGPAGRFRAPELSRRFGYWPQSDIWSLGCTLARVVAFGLEGLEGVDTFDQRFPGSQNPRMFDAIGGRDPEDHCSADFAGARLVDGPAQWRHRHNYLLQFVGGFGICFSGAVQVSMRRRPTARAVHGAPVAIHRALQGQSDISRVTFAIHVRSSDRQLEGCNLRQAPQQAI
ncbi:kinase-like domain-containing protein [Aspergillus germanicus]